MIKLSRRVHKEQTTQASTGGVLPYELKCRLGYSFFSEEHFFSVTKSNSKNNPVEIIQTVVLIKMVVIYLSLVIEVIIHIMPTPV